MYLKKKEAKRPKDQAGNRFWMSNNILDKVGILDKASE